MGRAPCCDKANVKKGPWSPEEDAKLKEFIEKHGTGGNWIALPKKAGLKRCGKSCRLRWLNYLRPNIKHGEFSEEEDRIICTLYANIGSRWSIIAAQLPGRTDNDIKNYWNTKLKKKKKSLGMFPYQGKTAGPLQHKYPLPPPPPPYHHHHHPQQQQQQQQQQQPSSVIRPSFHDIDAQTLRNINYGTPSLTGLEAFPHSSEDVFINTSVQAPILHHHQLKDNDDSSWKNHTKSPVDYYCFGGIGAGDVGHQQTSLDDAFNSAGGFGEPMTPTLLFNSVEGSDSGGGSSLLLGRSREQAWSIDYLQSGYDQDRNKEMIPPIDGCDDNPFLDELCNMVIRGSRNFEEAQVKGTHHN